MKRSLVMALTLVAGHVAASGSLMADVFQVTENWSIEITPAQKVPVDVSAVPVAPAQDSDEAKTEKGARKVDAAEYQRIYRSIPFNRAEYDANPNYRHDSTMEILTGNARHQTIIERKTTNAVPAAQPVQPAAVPYRYNNPDWGLNYYFYFPYWNYRGIF